MKTKTGIMIVILTILLIALITALGKAFGSKDKSSIEFFLEAVIATIVLIACILIGMKLIYNIDISTQFKQNLPSSPSSSPKYIKSDVRDVSPQSSQDELISSNISPIISKSFSIILTFLYICVFYVVV